MEDLIVFNINHQLRVLEYHVLETAKNTNQFATHLAKSDSERQKLKNEIIANVEQINKNYEPHMPRNPTPLTEEKISVKGSLTTFLRENVISSKDIPKLETWPTFSGEVAKLHTPFTRTSKKWYYKMRQDHGKHDWSWWKSEMITKLAKNSWRFKMEDAFENAIFNPEKDKPLTWFFKKKDRLSALHPDMSDTMINMKIL
ncbi:hypothetical protein O181_059019 [Austropuccinia psidii MF-1]|uniref:Uncharacterized protein n=1 Tax=Austropuccinia psidii MF-1 TaxID=1389203 RepID=A0A9Q3EDL6_9BASI|nr:hypothetical protein [Austropuccinia psidii MF-1]